MEPTTDKTLAYHMSENSTIHSYNHISSVLKSKVVDADYYVM